jgi:hypothetical protein
VILSLRIEENLSDRSVPARTRTTEGRQRRCFFISGGALAMYVADLAGPIESSTVEFSPLLPCPVEDAMVAPREFD